MASGARKLLAFSILVGGLGLAWLLRPLGQGFGFGPGSGGRLILRKEGSGGGQVSQEAFRFGLLPALSADQQGRPMAGRSGSSSHSGGSAVQKILKPAPPVLPPHFPYPQSQGSSGPAPNKPTSPTGRRHRIVDGDSLEKLAERYLGSSALAHRIYEANRPVLPDPNLLPIGVEIVIPPPDPDQPISSNQVRQGKLVPLAEVCSGAGGSGASAPSGTP